MKRMTKYKVKATEYPFGINKYPIAWMKDMIGVSIGTHCLSEYFIDGQQNFVDISINSDERKKFVICVSMHLRF